MDTENRTSRGRSRDEASFPAPGGKDALPSDYMAVFAGLRERIQSERLRVTLAANAAMVLLYWDVGRVILERQAHQGWGARAIDRLSHDLMAAFPEMKGLSPRNLKYMRKFAVSWPDRAIVQRTVAQIPWRSNVALLDKLDDPDTRLWYVRNTVEYGVNQLVCSVSSVWRIMGLGVGSVRKPSLSSKSVSSARMKMNPLKTHGSR